MDTALWTEIVQAATDHCDGDAGLGYCFLAGALSVYADDAAGTRILQILKQGA